MRTVVFSFGCLLLGLSSITLADSTKVPCLKGAPIINTHYGSLCGLKQTKYGQPAFAYLGIPYAKPPVGQLRWQPPHKLDPWKPRLYHATALGDACPQPSSSPAGFSGSENCLYLNVWKPTGHSRASLPVLVFIPGGGFITGSGGYPSYNGTYMASLGKVIVVTINYRLGVIGFLRYQQKQSHIDGNFGILDQLAAMRWVHDNIAAFGGDPNKITLFGESAGAMSVGLHLFSIPASKHLFRAGIMESNVMSVPFASPKKANKYGNHYAASLCKLNHLNMKTCPMTAQWLRKLPLATVMQAANKTIPAGGVAGLLLTGMTQGIAWAPIAHVFPIVGPANQGYQPGTTPKPFIIGTNRNEGVFFIPGANHFTNAQYQKILVKNFGQKNALRILNFTVNGKKPYNPANYHYDRASDMTAAAQAVAKAMTDYAFTGSSLYAAKNTWKQMQAAGLPIFGYRFTQDSNFNYAIYKRCGPLAQNICHTEEIPYVFHNFVERLGNTTRVLPADKITANEKALSTKMVLAWTGFATHPTDWKKGLGYPPLNNPLTGPYINWRNPVQPIHHLNKLVNYEFWSSISSSYK